MATITAEMLDEELVGGTVTFGNGNCSTYTFSNLRQLFKEYKTCNVVFDSNKWFGCIVSGAIIIEAHEI